MKSDGNSQTIGKIINKINEQKLSLYSNSIHLKYGYPVLLKNKDLTSAKHLNSVYESLVWGTRNDASNQSLRNDERAVLTKWLKNTPFSNRVLEVGCGSGRVTRLLGEICENVVALDREEATLKALKQSVSGAPRKRISTLCHDFSIPKFKNRFSAVVLIENLLGMNPRSKDREEIIRNTYESLKPKGIAVFGYRVNPLLPEGGLLFQAMPYGDLFGIAINWTDTYFFNSVAQATHNKLTLIDHKVGQVRPAGGRMHFAIFQKSS